MCLYKNAPAKKLEKYHGQVLKQKGVIYYRARDRSAKIK